MCKMQKTYDFKPIEISILPCLKTKLEKQPLLKLLGQIMQVILFLEKVKRFAL